LRVDDGGAAIGREGLANLLRRHLTRLEALHILLPRGRIVAVEIRRAHREHRIVRQRRLERRVREALGFELTLDPPLEAHLPHALDIARPRAIAQAIEDMEDPLVFPKGW